MKIQLQKAGIPATRINLIGLPERAQITINKKQLRLQDLKNNICQTPASSISHTPNPTVDQSTPAKKTKNKPRKLIMPDWICFSFFPIFSPTNAIPEKDIGKSFKQILKYQLVFRYRISKISNYLEILFKVIKFKIFFEFNLKFQHLLAIGCR